MHSGGVISIEATAHVPCLIGLCCVPWGRVPAQACPLATILEAIKLFMA